MTGDNMTFKRKNLGNEGEKKACDYLELQGFEVLEMNHRNKIGEIDIIAKDGDILCFVEVKTKTGEGFGLPEEMVNSRKQQKIIRTAECYLIEKELVDVNWRIDVIAVDSGKGEIRLIKNAVER